MDLSGIEEAIVLAERRWPRLTFKRKTPQEACSPCPACGGQDRFILWGNGYYLCREGDGHCGQSGWLDDDQDVKLSPEELRLRRIEAEQCRQARELAEHNRRLSVIERMMQCTDHLTYHAALDADDRIWWHDQGITDRSIDEYQLGVCYSCPTDAQHRPSYTIPVYDSTGSKLLNIRHRIVNASNGDKYRPHMPGLGSQLFNSRFVKTEHELVLVEGCKKSIVVTQEFGPAIGSMGTGNFDMAWLSHFDQVKRLYVAFDPDAYEKAGKLAQEIKGKRRNLDVRLCRFPTKPDDFLIQYGTIGQFKKYLSLAWRVN